MWPRPGDPARARSGEAPRDAGSAPGAAGGAGLERELIEDEAVRTALTLLADILAAIRYIGDLLEGEDGEEAEET